MCCARHDDFCVFDMDNLSLMFGGRSSRLVHDDVSGAYVAEADAGLRIERFEGGANGVWHGEHWRLTTQDGTQYWFGTGHSSTQDVTVFGDDPLEACASAFLVGSYCQMGTDGTWTRSSTSTATR